MSTNTSAPIPHSPGPFPVSIPVNNVPESSGLWDRITTWASEHKGTVYAIAGVTLVVTAAGTMYYLSSDNNNKDASAPGAPAANKRKTKRDRKKAKERAEKEASEKKEEPAGMRTLHVPESCMLISGQSPRRLP